MPADARRDASRDPDARDPFAHRVLAWWEAHGRKDLPWQRERTPYRVWVAEIMLQQTQVATVVPYFERFIARFPDVDALAGADVDEVLHLWSGLGYYARARNLHRAADIVARDHGGVVPDTVEGVGALPGIGCSTAGAIVAQAYGTRAAILDGNVKRVLARRHRVAGPVSSSATLGELWRLAESHTPTDRAVDYTQAVMDLGATVCRRTRPRCGDCPVRADCLAFARGDPERYPERAPRRKRRLERSRFFVLVDPDGACLVERRPPRGIWGGLWSPPERGADQTLAGFLDEAGIDAGLVDQVRAAGSFRHGFTHYDLDVEPVYVRLKARPAQVRERPGRWIDPDDHRLGLSTVAARLVAVAGRDEPLTGNRRHLWQDQGMTTINSGTAAAVTSQQALHALLREVLPPQGAWSDEEYLWLTDRCNRLVEFTDGHVQELPMPTFTHQAALLALYRLLHDFLVPRGGVVMVAALRMRIREGKFREPDLLLLRDRSDARCEDRYWLGADLVAEVVSPDDPERDLVEKRADYAEAGIPEYWIVDPRNETITVLALDGDTYVEHGVYAAGESASSVLLAGFAAEVTGVFDAPRSGA